MLYELLSCLDDAIAIFVALQSPEIEVIGLTTIFGNVHTTLSTRNALHLVKFLPLFHSINQYWTRSLRKNDFSHILND